MKTFNTSYLKLLKPCLYDFGRAGIYNGQLFPWLIRENDSFMLVGINGCLEYSVSIGEYVGIRVIMSIKK